MEKIFLHELVGIVVLYNILKIRHDLTGASPPNATFMPPKLVFCVLLASYGTWQKHAQQLKYSK